MKEFLAILFMILVGLVPEIIKAVKKNNKNPQRPQTSPAYEPEEVEFESDNNVTKIDENLSKEPEYFTFETIEPEIDKEQKTVQNMPPKYSQIIENEKENNIDITFDKEEIAKGVIYSEILKRKYN